MRLPGERRLVRVARNSAGLTLALALGACGIGGGPGLEPAPIAVAPVNGPQADYPVVIGQPYSIGGVAYAPEDVMNYDEVGYVAADRGGGRGVSGSHHTLPLPSYVEVTSLETGRTILVRIERRGPMESNDLVALSPGALNELGAAPGTPVRVRRVNPPEDQRMLLRAGQPAAARMDTPMPLVDVLTRTRPAARPAPVFAAAQPPPQAAPGVRAGAPIARPGAPALPPLPLRPGVALSSYAPQPVPVARPRAVENGYIVQAAAFSTPDRAQRAANVLGGEVSRAGQYYRVHTGPFATLGEAEASLAKVRAAGYTDARIYTSG